MARARAPFLHVLRKRWGHQGILSEESKHINDLKSAVGSVVDRNGQQDTVKTGQNGDAGASEAFVHFRPEAAGDVRGRTERLWRGG